MIVTTMQAATGMRVTVVVSKTTMISAPIAHASIVLMWRMEMSVSVRLRVCVEPRRTKAMVSVTITIIMLDVTGILVIVVILKRIQLSVMIVHVWTVLMSLKAMNV
jgi:hypothetical protein